MTPRAAPLAVLWLAAAATPAAAADLVISPRLSQSLGYDTNVDLSTDNSGGSGSGGNGEGAATATTEASVAVARKAPAAELQLNGRVNFTQNFAGRSNSYNGEYLDGVLSRSFTARTQAQLQAGFSAYNSLDNIQDSNGRNLNQDQRNYNVNVGPSLSHKLTRLDSAVVSGGWSRQFYDSQDDNEDGNVPTSAWNSSLGWRRILSQRATGGVNLAGSHIDSSRDNTWTLSPQLYFSYEQERRITLSTSVGPQLYWSRSQQQGFDGQLETTDESGIGAFVSVEASYQATQRLDLTLDLSNNIQPANNNGLAATVTSVGLGAGYELTRRLSLTADGSYQRRNSLGPSGGDDQTDDDRDYLQAQLGIVYALTPSVDLSLNYRYRYQKFDEDSDSADSNAVFVRVDWRLPDWRPFR